MQQNCTQRKMLEKNYRAGLRKVALLRKDNRWYYVDKSKRKDVK
nr:MAG TPA: SEC-C motif-c motif containing protein, Structural [Caudoviricetes sp.]